MLPITAHIMRMKCAVTYTAHIMPMGVGGGTRPRAPRAPLYVSHTQQRLFFTIYTQSPHVVNLFRPIEYLTHPILQTVQLSNRRNGDGELGYFPVFMPRPTKRQASFLPIAVHFKCVYHTHVNHKELVMATKPGLYANINAKQERIKNGSNEKMRKVGTKGAPTKADFIKSAKTAKKK